MSKEFKGVNIICPVDRRSPIHGLLVFPCYESKLKGIQNSSLDSYFYYKCNTMPIITIGYNHTTKMPIVIKYNPINHFRFLA